MNVWLDDKKTFFMVVLFEEVITVTSYKSVAEDVAFGLDGAKVLECLVIEESS